jgi:putative ABC transport system ATP-binding protein
MSIIQVNGITKYFGGLRALYNISFVLEKGEILGLIGPNGAGKTTLFNIVGGLTKPTECTVYIDRTDISKLDASELAWLRCRKIGYIFQTFNLIPIMSALQNVMLPLIFAGIEPDERADRAYAMLKLVGLGDRARHKPAELSGGQQQRVAIARALSNSPSLLLADEPTGNLDTRTSADIMGVFQKLNDQGMTLVMVTHELDVAQYTKRMVVMRDGQVVSDTPVAKRLIAETEVRRVQEEQKAAQLAY